MKRQLTITNLNTVYYGQSGPVHLLKDLSIKVHSGTCVGIVGESGCGKTTLIDAVFGTLRMRDGGISSGTIAYSENDLREHQKEIIGKKLTYIPQDPNSSFDEFCSMYVNFVEILRAHMPEARQSTYSEKIEKTLTSVGLDITSMNVKSYPHQLSGGMKQRILIALALITNPEMIIADEPTSDLDVTLEMQIVELLLQLKNTKKKTLLLTTHNLLLAKKLCDYIYVMNDGMIVESGTPDKLFNAPEHSYTRELITSLLI